MSNNNHSFLLSGVSDEAGSPIQLQIQAHVELGWKEIELRTINGKGLADLDDFEFQNVCSLLASSGLRVLTIASRIANWDRPISLPFEKDEEELKVLAERMHMLGAKYVRIMSYPNDGLSEQEWRKRVIDRMHRLTAQASNAGIVLLHENCAGWGGISAENTLHLLKEINHPSFRLLFDIGNGIAHHYDAYTFLQRVWPYVEHVHIKDGMLQNDKVIYTLPGEGHSKVRECLLWLYEHNYRGILAIEPHLHLIPHLKQSGDQNDLFSSYIKYGRHLESILSLMFSQQKGVSLYE